MLVGIDPPLIGQQFGMGSLDICDLILSTRHQGYTLFPVTEWPSHVYVSRILDESILGTSYIDTEKVELIAWGLIFPTAEEAATYAKESGNGAQ
jgi:hypothetical protein